MLTRIGKFKLEGKIVAPPSKSMAHRLLIVSSLCKGKFRINNIAYSKDIIATIDSLKALGVKIDCFEDYCLIDSSDFLSRNDELKCNESGSTLRFLLPLCLLTGNTYRFTGSKKLLSRPLSVYEDLCKQYGFYYLNTGSYIEVKGILDVDHISVPGNISSQFITGLMFSLCYLNKDSKILITNSFESSSYVLLTVKALNDFGFNVKLDDNTILIEKSKPLSSGEFSVEADESNCAYIDAFNYLDSNIKIIGQDLNTLQGDRIYKEYFKKIADGYCDLDLKDCPDLGPILIALSALKYGCHLSNTSRLALKECDRSQAMKQELEKLGANIKVDQNDIYVDKCEKLNCDTSLDSHNDHRILMALTLILSRCGGTITQSESVCKSYPDYFEKIKALKGVFEHYDD